MTDLTKGLINDFQKSGDLHMLPSIIIGMQSEDNVDEHVPYKNCFKLLRNMAAHEPDTLVSQITDRNNIGCQRLVFACENERRVSLDVYKLVIWMFYMATSMGNEYYITFIKTLMLTLYPKSIENYSSGSGDIFNFTMNRGDLILTYLSWARYMYINYNLPRTIAVADLYTMNVVTENPSLFWKMALPDMMPLTLFYMSNKVNCYNKLNLEYFLKLFNERTGVV